MNLGEVVSTFLLLLIGLGSGMLMKHVPQIIIGLFWGSAVIIASLIGEQFGTTNMNPIFSVAELLQHKINTLIFFNQIIGQLVGALLATILLLILSGMTNSQQMTKFAAIATSKNAPQNFFLEMIGSLILLSVSAVIGNLTNMSLMITIVMGITVGTLIVLIGPITGASFNPTRDLVPRLGLYCYLKYVNKKSIDAKQSLISSTVAPILAAVIFSIILTIMSSV